jgi:hypothetical protein
MADSDSDPAPQPLDEEEMAALAGRLETLPIEHVDWVLKLYLECQRAREGEGRLMAESACRADSADTTQLVLDTADWLRTLWEVGYMGGDAFPAPPRSDFPHISVNDILKSALFARIRGGKHPLPFPPPTRNGMPWHEAVESDEAFRVRVDFLDDDWCRIDGCTDWQVTETVVAGSEYRVQHQGKGPIYRLSLDGEGGGELQKRPAAISRRILRQERAGIVSYLLEWPAPNGDTSHVPLRAANWDRAENEAQRWVALRHADLYGQIRFERCEA